MMNADCWLRKRCGLSGKKNEKKKRKLVIDGEDRLSVERDVDQLYFLFF